VSAANNVCRCCGASPDRAVPARLHPDDIKQVAHLVIEGLSEREMTTRQSAVAFDATADDIARLLGKKAAWVRKNAAALGGVRIGRGNKPRHHFNIEIAAERIAAMGRDNRDAPPANGPRDRVHRSRRRAPDPTVPLLPIKGRERRDSRP
jgi:hypothetical protein